MGVRIRIHTNRALTEDESIIADFIDGQRPEPEFYEMLTQLGEPYTSDGFATGQKAVSLLRCLWNYQVLPSIKAGCFDSFDTLCHKLEILTWG